MGLLVFIREPTTQKRQKGTTQLPSLKNVAVGEHTGNSATAFLAARVGLRRELGTTVAVLNGLADVRLGLCHNRLKSPPHGIWGIRLLAHGGVLLHDDGRRPRHRALTHSPPAARQSRCPRHGKEGVGRAGRVGACRSRGRGHYRTWGGRLARNRLARTCHEGIHLDSDYWRTPGCDLCVSCFGRYGLRQNGSAFRAWLRAQDPFIEEIHHLKRYKILYSELRSNYSMTRTAASRGPCAWCISIKKMVAEQGLGFRVQGTRLCRKLPKP